jgi:hypothetical protein
MRDKLISKVVELSTKVNNDDLAWFVFDRYSNEELLDIYKELAIQEYIHNEYTRHSKQKL